MKKRILFLTIIVGFIVGVIVFLDSHYFFNRYIAPKIIQYGFNYQKVEGTLLSGFKLNKLSYKQEPLATKVEMRFNPLALLQKEIFITKLHLIEVEKKSLKKIIDNFKPSSSPSNTSLDFNLYLKNINLSFKPFEVEGIKIKQNQLKIEYLKLTKNSFNLGKSHYIFDTDIGKINFNGYYKKKVLSIDTFSAKNFKLNDFLVVAKKLKKDFNISNTDTNSSNVKSYFLFIPQKVAINNLDVELKPFKLDFFASKKLQLKAKDTIIDIKKAKLLQTKINLEFLTNIGNIYSYLVYNRNLLDIKNIKIDIKKADKILSLIRNSQNSTTTSINLLEFIPIQKVLANTININIKKFTYQKNSFLGTLLAKSLRLDLKRNKISLDNLFLKVKSSLFDIKLNSLIKKDTLFVKSLDLKAVNVNKLFKFIEHFKEKNSSKKSLAFSMPIKNIFLKEGVANFKYLSFGEYKIKKGRIHARAFKLSNNFKDFNASYLKVSVVSNWGNAFLKGKVLNKNFYAKGKCQVTQKLLDRFSIPLIAKNLEPLVIYKSKFNLDELELKTTLNGKKAFSFSKEFSFLKSKNYLYYNYHTNKVVWKLNGDIKYDNFAWLKVENELDYLNKLRYYGNIKVKKFLLKTPYLQNLLNSLKVNYEGDSKGIKAYFVSKYLKAMLDSKDYKKANILVQNKNTLPMAVIIPKINNYKISTLQAKTILNFKKIFPIKGKYLLKSNLFSSNGEFNYDKNLLLKGEAKFTHKLKEIKNLPAKYELLIAKEALKTNVKIASFLINSQYSFKNKLINILLKSTSLKANINGAIDSFTYNIQSTSLQKSIKELSKIFPINLKSEVDGAINAKGSFNQNKLSFLMHSNKITINKTIIEKLNLQGSLSKNELLINSYNFLIKGYKFYANKASFIDLKNHFIKVFWVNNSLKLTGKYSLSPLKANLQAIAQNFRLENSDGKVNLILKNKIFINKEKIKIDGVVLIIDGIIKKNLKRLSSEDDDIIILQRQKVKESTNFAKNIALNLKISTKKGVIYKQSDSYFILKPQLKVTKSFGKLSKIEGVILLDKKSYYLLKGKKLSLVKGKILFKGKSTTPYLDITLKYNGREYKIYVSILGTANKPILNFRSSPPLTKDQILAYLLFDDSSAAGTHSQESMVNIIGGTLAKSFLGSIGLKIDHIILRENGFTIGKNIGKHIIIYYNQEGEKASIKTRVDITKSVHTEIEVGKESQSADIIFSKEY